MSPSATLAGFDRALAVETGSRILGADEVGRGALAGPVVAAAVILASGDGLDGVRDSKMLAPAERTRQAAHIRAGAIAVAWSFVAPSVIDRINIRQASLLALRRAVHRAVRQVELRSPRPLAGSPWLALIDGNDPVPGLRVAQQTVVRGDAQSCAIAAASIIAKTVRDGFMERIAAEYPDYGFDRHKGYGTDEHRAAIDRLGPCRWHRLSFSPVAQIPLFAP